MSLAIVGNCPKCGAPIYASALHNGVTPPLHNGVTPPPAQYSCNCRNESGSQTKGFSDFDLRK